MLKEAEDCKCLRSLDAVNKVFRKPGESSRDSKTRLFKTVRTSENFLLRVRAFLRYIRSRELPRVVHLRMN